VAKKPDQSPISRWPGILAADYAHKRLEFTSGDEATVSVSPLLDSYLVESSVTIVLKAKRLLSTLLIFPKPAR
jgi:hypothetical protein